MAKVAALDEHTSAWWLRKGDAAARAVWAWIDTLKQRHRTLALIDLIHEAIYEGRPLSAVTDNPGAEYLRRQNSKSAPANLNITRSMVDTVTSKLGKRRPMPVVSSDDAAFTQKLFAKRASRVLRRKLGKPDVERALPMVLRDAIIKGTGVAKAVRVGGDVQIERVPKEEIIVDPREARYGAPRSLAQVKIISREVLAEAFPKHARQIAEASKYTAEGWDPLDADVAVDSDLLEVGEAWHLPSAPDADDGLHLITIRGCVLLAERWRRCRFPFAFIHWSAPTRGFWGHGLVEDLTGIQAKVNDLARDIQEGLYYGATLKVFLPRTANVNKNHLRARHPVVIEYDGAPPAYVAPNAVSAQQVQFLEWLIQKAYEISGISQLSASSKNPLGANASGKALDTMDDIESDRFAHVQMGYAMFRCDIGQALIDEAQALAEDKTVEKKSVAAWIREIEWRKVKVDEGDFHLAMEAQNFLPDSRAGKLSYIAESAKAGLLRNGSVETLALMDEPDLNRANRYLLGPYRAAERLLEDLTDLEVPIADLIPDPQMDPALLTAMVKGQYNDIWSSGRHDDDEVEEILERHLTILSHCKGLTDQAAKGAAGPAGPPGGGGFAPTPIPAGMMPPMAAGAPMGMAA